MNALAVAGAGMIALYTSKVLINLFGPQPKFTIKNDLGAALDSEEFVQFLSLVTDGTRRKSRVRRLKNGAEFYPEYLKAVRGAKLSVNLEFYEFLEGRVSRELRGLCGKGFLRVDLSWLRKRVYGDWRCEFGVDD